MFGLSTIKQMNRRAADLIRGTEDFSKRLAAHRKEAAELLPFLNECLFCCAPCVDGKITHSPFCTESMHRGLAKQARLEGKAYEVRFQPRQPNREKCATALLKGTLKVRGHLHKLGPALAETPGTFAYAATHAPVLRQRPKSEVEKAEKFKAEILRGGGL